MDGVQVWALVVWLAIGACAVVGLMALIGSR